MAGGFLRIRCVVLCDWEHARRLCLKDSLPLLTESADPDDFIASLWNCEDSETINLVRILKPSKLVR